jgi:hypothetical protein
MAMMTRRKLIYLAAGGAATLVGLRLGLPHLMSPRTGQRLSDEALALIEHCFEGIDRTRMLDSHVHLIGLGAGGSGCWIHPEMMSRMHPINRLRYDMFAGALGMQNDATADMDYVYRLLALQRQANPSGHLLMLAFDQNVDSDGRLRPDYSPFYTPNEYVLAVASEHEELLACASIHPYRPDAVDRLDAVAAAGARAIKWLPNARGIDPESPLCAQFYRRLAELDLPLISHAGREYAVHTDALQELGNPLRLRTALDAGVRVVVAHCASLGSMLDTDAGDSGTKATAFDLFMRMMREPRYEGRLFGDISAVTQVNRGVRVVRDLLRARELHPRLVNGSDYPVAALRILFSPTRFEMNGLLNRRQRRLCSEIAQINPLLFDFVLKRCLAVRDGDGIFRFSPIIFESARIFMNPENGDSPVKSTRESNRRVPARQPARERATRVPRRPGPHRRVS